MANEWTPEQEATLNSLKARLQQLTQSQEGLMPGAGIQPSSQTEQLRLYQGLSPEQQRSVDVSRSEGTKTVLDIVTPGWQDVAAGGGLEAGALMAAKSWPGVGLLGRAAIGAGTALGANELLQAAPEVISQAASATGDVAKGVYKGAKEWLNSPLDQPRSPFGSIREGVQQAGKRLDPNKSTLDIVSEASGGVTVDDVVNLAAGKVVGDAGAIALKKLKPIVDVEGKLQKLYAQKATEYMGFQPNKLRQLEVGVDGKQQPALFDAIINIAKDGTTITRDMPTAATLVANRQAEIWREIEPRLKAAGDAYFTKIANHPQFAGIANNPDWHAELLANKVRQRLQTTKLKMINEGKEVWLKDLDAGADYIENALLDASQAAREAGYPGIPLDVRTLNALKTSIYKGSRFGAANPPESAVFVDRQLGRAIKETIEEIVDDPELGRLNKLYGDYEDVNEAITGRIGQYYRGEQGDFGAKMQGLMTLGALTNMPNQQQSSNPINMGLKVAFGALMGKAIYQTPAVRKAVANFSLALSQRGLPNEVANAYAGRVISDLALDDVMATPIERRTDRSMSIEVTGPRIAKSLMEQGAPIELALQEGMRLAQGLASDSPIERENSMLELSQFGPSSLEKSEYRSVINGKFHDPMEQSHYISRSLRSAKSLKDEADAMEAGLSGRIKEELTPQSARIQPPTIGAQSLPSIDLEYIDQSFQMPEYSTPQFSLSADSSPDEDLVGRLKRLSAGTDLEQY